MINFYDRAMSCENTFLGNTIRIKRVLAQYSQVMLPRIFAWILEYFSFHLSKVKFNSGTHGSLEYSASIEKRH